MVFPTFFYLSLNFTIRCLWLEPQSAPGLVFADNYSFSIFSYKECNQFDFGIGHLVMSMHRVLSWVVGKGYLLWLAWFLDKTLLAFALLHFVLRGQICLLLQVSLDFWLLHSITLQWKWHLLGVLVLQGLVELHRTVQLQLIHHYWSEHRLGLLWYWMVCLGNELRSFCCFWDHIQVLNFGLFCLLLWILHFF